MMGELSYSPIERFNRWESLSVGAAYDPYLESLDEARHAASASDLDLIKQSAIREAAVESGAIEGLYGTNRGVTETIATLGASWEIELRELGPSAPELFQAHLDAFALVLDAVTNASPLSESWVRQLHQKATFAQARYKVRTPQGYQQHALKHGEYKKYPNNVELDDGTVHHYAPIDQVPVEMNRLVNELRSEEFLAAHPVLQAAYAHHAFAAIHPFSDGNGRVARSLASVFLFRGPGIPLVIFSDQKVPYFDALASADRGEPQKFVDFLDDRVLDSMMLFAQRLKAVNSALGNAVADFRNLLKSHGNLSHHEVQAVGSRLFDRIMSEFSEQTQSILPAGINSSLENPGGHHQCDLGDPDYRTLGRGGFLKVALTFIDPPFDLRSEITPVIGVSSNTETRFAFVVIDTNRPGRPRLELRINELYPSISPAAGAKLKGWIESALGAAIAELNGGIVRTIRNS